MARSQSKDLDHWAANRFYAALIAYPFSCALLALGGGLTLGPIGAAAGLVLLPATGPYALAYFLRARALVRAVCAFVTAPRTVRSPHSSTPTSHVPHYIRN